MAQQHLSVFENFLAKLTAIITMQMQVVVEIVCHIGTVQNPRHVSYTAFPAWTLEWISEQIFFPSLPRLLSILPRAILINQPIKHEILLC